MDESAKSAEKVRRDLNSFRNKSFTISATEQCVFCEGYLFMKPFLIFPCGHKFHGDCLEKNLVLLLKSDPSKQILTEKISNRDSKQLHKGLTSSCLYCGEIMIDNLDQPFIDNWENVNNGWE